ncbi:MAG: sigma-70 family RNA polymerase sigma factor, partial [Alphaproteobacteria bacterium]|nr:sigma-70 family RNA polymerase sigma factor [Alphaproteobacteria bacterium]
GEDQDLEIQDFLVDDRPGPESVAIDDHDRRLRLRWLSDALGELSARERTIIAERRLRDEGVTLEELGKELGVSKERVRQLEARALGKLKAALEKRAGSETEVFGTA